MAKQTRYWDVDRVDYETSTWDRDRLDDLLKNYQIINIETLEKVIRFWYNKEE